MEYSDLNKQYNLLIDNLIRDGYLKSVAIIQAFRRIKRMDFVLPGDEEKSLLNVPLNIKQGQTISQPATVAIMLELLQVESGDLVLDVGSGSGWTTALLAELVGVNGKVFGLEILPDICNFGTRNIGKYNFIEKKIVKNFCGNGYDGLKRFAPFDKILVSAAAEQIPNQLLRQLKIGGRLVIPVGPKYATQELLMIEKNNDKEYKEISYQGFIFVPLINS